MKKILSFCAALLMAIVANAAVIEITPTSPHSSDNLRQALNEAADGDEIVMAAGTYVESNGDYIAFNGKSVEVRAAEGAEVILQPQVPIRLKEGAAARFIGIRFDCGHLCDLSNYENIIVPADDTEDKAVYLEDCEFFNWQQDAAIIRSTTSRRLSAVLVKNCYIHDINKSFIFLENTNAAGVAVSNSTFENVSTQSGYSAGVIDTRATSGTFSVDHCTFYNVQAMNTDFGAIGKVKTPDAIVSNSIFMLPVGQDGIRAIRDVAEAVNCLTYNYTESGKEGIHGDVVQTNCLKGQDPLFVDAANGDFTLGEGSPALTLNAGEAIGDPRWVPAVAPAPLSLTEFIDAKPTSEVELKDLTVFAAYAMGGKTYNCVIDEEGIALILFDATSTLYTSPLEAGKVLAGQKATYLDNHNQDVIIPTNTATISDGVAPSPTLMSVEPVEADVNHYIRLENVAAAKAADDQYYLFEGNIQLFAAEASLLPANDGTINVEGLLIKYDDQLELMVTAIEEVVVPIDIVVNKGVVLYDETASTEFAYWQIYAENEDYAVGLVALTDQLEGTFTEADLYPDTDLDYVYVYDVAADAAFAILTANVVVSVNVDGSVDFKGTLGCEDGNLYKIDIHYAEPKPESTKEITVSDINIYDYRGYYGWVFNGENTEEKAEIQLILDTEADDPSGDYTEADLDMYYSFLAIDEVAVSIYSATVHIEQNAGSWTITADLLSYDNVLYKVTMTKAPESINMEFSEGITFTDATAEDPAGWSVEIESGDLELAFATYDGVDHVAGTFNLNTELNPSYCYIIDWATYDEVVFTSLQAVNVVNADKSIDMTFTGTDALNNSYTIIVHVPAPTPSGVENAAGAVKAVKVIKNGQLIINRNGKSFNAAGAQVE